MQKIDGVKIAEEIIQKLKKQEKPEKILAAILIGENPISLNFLNQKKKIAEELGIDFRIYKFPENIKNDDLRKEAGKIVLLKRVGGTLVQLPLPKHLNRHYILNVIPREKDIDVLGERALGAFYTERNPVLPPAVGVIEEILNSKSYILNSKKVAVIGSGFLIGKPITTWLQNKAAEITIFNEYTKDLKNKLKDVDIVISGAGKQNLFSADNVEKNSLIIDFGCSTDENGKIHGDFNALSSSSNPPFLLYTPTPGGVGPILVAKIFENFYKLNKI